MQAIRRFLVTTSIASLGLVAAGLPSQAGTVSGNLTISATVVSACIMTGSVMSFGTAIDPTAASVPIDASASITVTCTATTPYSVALNAGTNAGGNSNFSARQIKNGTHTLGYQLYTDAARTAVWGDGTSTSTVYSGTGSGSVQSINVYGRLPSLSGAVPGAYSDVVTVTVTY